LADGLHDVRGRVQAVLSVTPPTHPEFAVHSSLPVYDKDDFRSRFIDVHHDLMHERAEESFLEAHIHVRMVPVSCLSRIWKNAPFGLA